MARQRHTPQRSCIGCGRKSPQRELIRLACDSDGRPVIDADRKLTGRGAYLCDSWDCWRQALGKGALERAFRRRFAVNDAESLRTQYLLRSPDAAGSEAI